MVLALVAEADIRRGNEARRIGAVIDFARRPPVTLPASVEARPKRAQCLTPERIHARYARKIWRHVAAVLGPDDEREDICQEVLITVLLKVGTLRDPACLDGWVAQVTSNTLKYVMRRRRIRRFASLDELPDRQVPSTQTDLHARNLAARALDVMARLPQNERALLATYWFSPATAESIATGAGCSVVTVRRRLYKAKARFQKLARNDRELAQRIDDADDWARRWSAASSDSPADAE